MCLARVFGRRVIGHEQRNLMTMIEIIEIHVCSLLVSGSTNGLSVARAYSKKNPRDENILDHYDAGSHFNIYFRL